MITDKMRRKVQRSRGSHSRTGIKSRNGIWNSIGIQLGRTFLKLGDFFFTDFPGSAHQSYSVFDFVFLHLYHQNVMSIFFICFMSQWQILYFIHAFCLQICLEDMQLKHKTKNLL